MAPAQPRQEVPTLPRPLDAPELPALVRQLRITVPWRIRVPPMIAKFAPLGAALCACVLTAMQPTSTMLTGAWTFTITWVADAA